MPPLPKDRVIKSRPFQNVGCDFMGPFTSKTLEKMYVCLYTCLTTRAVHLEVVENLSAGAFLNCFVRFVSRRGVPEIVRSDCGTTFKLGEVIITKMFCDLNENGRSLMSYCASQRIKWIFNPPGSPWMGGASERLVGLTKKAFNKSIGRKRLSFADMCTVMGNGKEGPGGFSANASETTCLVDMPVDTRAYLEEVTLQLYMKTQTTVLDVLLATETQKAAELQGNMLRRVV
ncbi:hypothetical protein RB195_024464 [Necator americanus]|uniref:Integrase catalytic domain-containing protein n=1 Tax=Necator americanus TaxID=51031 RepID=A0ABR1EQH4_NECAM